ncbi:MAG TPA: histidine kinase dimerization/phospho-acceptor domain-containing protein, partial [Nitrospiria bacterium]|nr:histidine kinase dimerization/phospho-acceptor domain-containing protein [Nitrospiria bacterium]
MIPKVTLLFITVLLNLSLVLTIYLRGRRNPINVFYNLIVLSVAVWAFCYGMLELSTQPGDALFWYYLTYVAGSLIASFFFYFSFVFPTQERSFTAADHLLAWGFPIVSLCLLADPHILIREIALEPSGWSVVLGKPAFWTYSFWLTLLMGRAFLHLYQKYQRALGRPKMQLRYVLFGTAISTFFGSIFNLIMPGMGDTNWIWLGPLFEIILVGSTAYGIVKHRLMDIRVIFNRAIVYSIFLIITLALYTMVVLTSQQFFKDTTGVVASLIIGSVLIALGLEPLRKLIQKTTDRIFFKGEFVTQQLLGTITDTLSSIDDLERRLHIVTAHLATDLRVERAAFWIFGQDQNQITLKILEGSPMPSENLSPNAILQYFTATSVGEYVMVSQRRESLLYDETESPLSEQMDPDPILTTVFEEMKQLGMELIIPIFSKDILVGLLLMGSKRSGELYFNDDLKLLGIIAQEAGIAIDNARLYHRLQQQMEELKTMQTHQLLQSAKLATIGELATNIAHEINNPLTSILGFTTLLLKETGESDPRRKDLKIIESEAMRSRDIVRNLLDFARSKEPKKEAVGINEVVHDTLA